MITLNLEPAGRRINYVTELTHPGVEAIASSGNVKQRGFVSVRAGGLFPQLLLLLLGAPGAGGNGLALSLQG